MLQRRWAQEGVSHITAGGHVATMTCRASVQWGVGLERREDSETPLLGSDLVQSSQSCPLCPGTPILSTNHPLMVSALIKPPSLCTQSCLHPGTVAHALITWELMGPSSLTSHPPFSTF